MGHESLERIHTKACLQYMLIAANKQRSSKQPKFKVHTIACNANIWEMDLWTYETGTVTAADSIAGAIAD
jgi:hypothetical protein